MSDLLARINTELEESRSSGEAGSITELYELLHEAFDGIEQLEAENKRLNCLVDLHHANSLYCGACGWRKEGPSDDR